VDDWLGTFATPALKEYGILQHFGLDGIWQSARALLGLKELASQILEDDIARDALCQQFVQLGADLA